MVIHKSSGFVDALKNAGSFAINPLLEIEDDSLLGGGRVGHMLERTLEEMSSPVSLLSMALAPVTGGASVGFRSAMIGGQAAKIAAARGIGSKLAQSVALEGAASAGAVGAPKLVEAAGIDNQYAQMAAGLVAGFGAPAVLGRSTAIKSAASKAADVPSAFKRNIDEALDKEALFRADPTAASRSALDPDFVGILPVINTDNAVPKGYTRVARGDYSDVGVYDRAKTSESGLFGSGIYLTEDPTLEIATSYTTKGGPAGSIPTRKKVTQFDMPDEVIDRTIDVEKLGVLEISPQAKSEWMDQRTGKIDGVPDEVSDIIRRDGWINHNYAYSEFGDLLKTVEAIQTQSLRDGMKTWHSFMTRHIEYFSPDFEIQLPRHQSVLLRPAIETLDTALTSADKKFGDIFWNKGRYSAGYAPFPSQLEDFGEFRKAIAKELDEFQPVEDVFYGPRDVAMEDGLSVVPIRQAELKKLYIDDAPTRLRKDDPYLEIRKEARRKHKGGFVPTDKLFDFERSLRGESRVPGKKPLNIQFQEAGFTGYRYDGGKRAGGGSLTHEAYVIWDPIENINPHILRRKVTKAEQRHDIVASRFGKDAAKPSDITKVQRDPNTGELFTEWLDNQTNRSTKSYNEWAADIGEENW